ncbi:protein STICHEL-like [Tasmannia lanceolata]|uniref:protein STICHEL-like n=1 Tax=Tasmannia lanceolata TaxID=3420 RepID=UPI00406315AF
MATKTHLESETRQGSDTTGEQSHPLQKKRNSRGGSTRRKIRSSSIDDESYCVIPNETNFSSRPRAPFRRSFSSTSARFVSEFELIRAAFDLEKGNSFFPIESQYPNKACSCRNSAFAPWMSQSQSIVSTRRRGSTIDGHSTTRRRRSTGGLRREAALKAIIYEEEEKEEEEEEELSDGEASDYSRLENNSADHVTILSFKDANGGPSCRGKHYKHPHHPIDRSMSSNGRRSSINSKRSLSDKYEPKLFEDIVGHEINIKALSNAINTDKISPLYLFHGPRGTGKTSTAKIFTMASNCESNWPSKPCWSCGGCSRSLYITQLCSGSRSSGFDRIRTVLHSPAFTRAISAFRVVCFIIEQSHCLASDAWEEILAIVEEQKGYGCMVVFVMITEDPNKVPRTVSSRCQKFSFPKLKDMDITLKLARIVAREDIKIERGALRLITVKADGSLREAENILDQLGLLGGSRITTCMVQQLIGILPHNKLISLLDTALSEDAIKTVRETKELIASGIEPQALVSQLASLITDTLSGDASSSLSGPSSSKDNKRLLRIQSQHNIAGKSQSMRLCHALKVLVETEKQLKSSTDQATWVIAAVLQIAEGNISNTRSSTDHIFLPKDIIISTDDKPEIGSRPNSTDINWNGLAKLASHSKYRTEHLFNGIPEQLSVNASNNQGPSDQSVDIAEKRTGKMVGKNPNLTQFREMHEVWKNILERIHTQYLKEFLCEEAQLISLTVSRENAIVHLMFKNMEDKLEAEMSEETMSKALKAALGCPVTVLMSLQPTQLEITDVISVYTTEKEETHSSRSKQNSTTFIPISKGLDFKPSRSQKSTSTSENKLRSTRLQDSLDSLQLFQGHESQNQHIPSFSGTLSHGSRGDKSIVPETDSSLRDWTREKTSITRASQLRRHLLSLSSIPQADASVEPYSQDLLFENGNTDGQQVLKRNSKLPKFFPRLKEHHQHSVPQVGLNSSWSCSDILLRGKTMVKGSRVEESMNSYKPRETPFKDSLSLSISRSRKAQLDLRKTMPTLSTYSL